MVSRSSHHHHASSIARMQYRGQMRLFAEHIVQVVLNMWLYTNNIISFGGRSEQLEKRDNSGTSRQRNLHIFQPASPFRPTLKSFKKTLAKLVRARDSWEIKSLKYLPSWYRPSPRPSSSPSLHPNRQTTQMEIESFWERTRHTHTHTHNCCSGLDPTLLLQSCAKVLAGNFCLYILHIYKIIHIVYHDQ